MASDYPNFTDTMTLTFGDRAENHKGMQIIGQAAETGFTEQDLAHTQAWFQSQH